MKLALVQYSPEWENKEANKKKLLELISNSEADLFIFPEMSLTAFTMKSKKYTEKLEGESFKFFSDLSKQKNGEVIAGIIEKGKKKNFNTLIHISEKGKLKSSYRKIHPFSYSTENIHYGAGKEIVVSKSGKWKIGFTICYDLRFPELYRKYGKEKVDLIINIANWPDTRIEHWRTLLKARAIENQCYVAGVNRVGNDPKLKYIGYSSVFDPMGKELVTEADNEKILTVEIDEEYVKKIRKEFPFLNDIKLI